MNYYAIKYENTDTGATDTVFLQADNDAQAEMRFWDWLASGYGCDWDADATEVLNVHQFTEAA